MKKHTMILLVVAVLCAGITEAVVQNEWTFETDPAGRALTNAINSAPAGVAFVGADTATQTDDSGGLVCAHVAGGELGLWTDGAVLRADVVNAASPAVRFLRYDFDYDMTSTNNNSGTLLALSFTDGISSNLAGVALKYSDVATHPAGITETVFETDLELTGRIAVIAKVDLATQEMKVWYNLSGENNFNASNAPNHTVTSLSMTTIEELQFQATGDFIASTNESAVIDNIRTATTWEEITNPLADYSQAPEIFITSFSDQLGGAMNIGETNIFRVVMKNTLSPATNVTSTLTFVGDPGDFTMIPSNPVITLGANESVTNTYEVVAHTDGAYLFTAQAFESAQAHGAPATFALAVGRRVSYDSHTVANDLSGLIPGVAEPGESFDLIITNINSGGAVVVDITNSLTASSPTYFPTIIATNATVYPSMDPADTATTTYRVSCSLSTPDGLHRFTVINQAADIAWTNTFELEVFRRAEISVTNAVTLRVAPGEIRSVSVTLANVGNVGTLFTVTDDGRVPTLYAAEAVSVARATGFRFSSSFDSWIGSNTDPLEIGFDFSLFGTEYDSFSVNQAGFLTLESTNGVTAEVKVFKTADLVDQATIRHQMLTGNRLVIAWNYDGDNQNGDPLEFQVILNANGTIQYLYEYGTWGEGEAGLSDAQNEQTFNPVLGQTSRDALELTPAPWLTYDPIAGSIDGFGTTQTLTFTADATDRQATNINEFIARVGSETSTNAIAVTVIVEEENIQIDVPASFSFSGPAGEISPSATLTVTNSGNVALSYSITDSGLANAGYTAEFVDYQWWHIPEAADYILDESELGTDSIEIGFPFVYKGNTYTRLVVGIDRLTMGPEILWPFVTNGLSLNNDSSIRVLRDMNRTSLTVTWENILLDGGRENLTYQAILYRDGSIRYNYRQLDLEGVTYNGAPITEVVYTIGNVSLISDGDFSWWGLDAETNEVDVLRRVSLDVVPVQQRIITFSPVFGFIPVGGSSNITLKGDARSLTGTGSNDVSTNTTLTFNYGATNNASTEITFTATNSVETAFPDPVALWGTENPSVSSQQNSDGSRTLSWPPADDSLRREYTIWYTMGLIDPWTPMGTIDNGTVYTDRDPVRNAAPVIFYKVTVK